MPPYKHGGFVVYHHYVTRETYIRLYLRGSRVVKASPRPGSDLYAAGVVNCRFDFCSEIKKWIVQILVVIS